MRDLSKKNKKNIYFFERIKIKIKKEKKKKIKKEKR